MDQEYEGSGLFLSWGCGQFGQHGHHRTQDDVAAKDGVLGQFSKDRDGTTTSWPGSGGGSHQVKLFSCGASHTVVVTDSNEIFAWGNGKSGQLGTGDTETHLKPTQLYLPRDVESVSSSLDSRPVDTPHIKGVRCGGRHTFIWLDNGQMYSFGNNFYVQLGYDMQIKHHKDNQVPARFLSALSPSSEIVDQVGCGESHTLFLFDGGRIATIGNNVMGQIGTGDQNEAVVPYFQDDITDVVYIACGSNHNLVITGRGDVWVWGAGKPCGYNNGHVLSPVKKMKMCSTDKIMMVAGGQTHSLALSRHGQVYSWGYGPDGQLGHGKTITWLSEPRTIRDDNISGKVCHIATGHEYSASLLADGRLYLWGRNSHTIDVSLPASHKIYSPRLVNTGQRSLSRIECGAWHMAAITGRPEWTPLEAVEACLSRDDEDDDDDLHGDDLNQQVSAATAWQQDKVVKEDFDKLRSVMSRQHTVMKSLAEFYAPSPTPTPTESQSQTQTHCQTLPSHPDPGPNFSSTSNETGASHTHTGHVAVEIGIETKVRDAQPEFVTAQVAKRTISPSMKVKADHAHVHPHPTSTFMPAINDQLSPKSLRKKKDKDMVELQEATKLRSKTYIGQNTQAVLEFSTTSSDDFSLPQQRTALSNKSIDFLPAEMIRLDTRRLHNSRFVIDRHVPVLIKSNKGAAGLDGVLHRLPGSTGRKDRSSITKPRHLDHQHLRGGAIDHQHKKKEETWSLQGLNMDSTVERSFMIPRTVSFFYDNESYKPVQPNQTKRHVSIPHKSLQVPNVGGNKEKSGSRSHDHFHQGHPELITKSVTYSSASSWKHKSDRPSRTDQLGLGLGLRHHSSDPNINWHPSEDYPALVQPQISDGSTSDGMYPGKM